jgi:ATP-dependent protease ClpP protease subunit
LGQASAHAGRDNSVFTGKGKIMKQQNKTPWTMTAAKGGELEIRLFDVIGEDFWSGGGITAKQFADDLKAAGNVRSLKILINSVGGNVWDGLGIFDTLRAHPATVRAEVRGLCASIASVILMAAEPGQIAITPTSSLMIHNPSTLVGGDSNEMRRMADVMDKVKSSMVKAYQRHTTKSVSEIGAIMDAETWFTPKEAIAAGFADTITSFGDDDDDADVAASVDLSHFRRVPAQISARFSRFLAVSDESERRRRTSRLRTLELHNEEIAESRRQTLAMNESELARMREEDTPEAQRRRKLAQHASELRPGGRIANITDPDRDTVRRRTMAARTRELGRMREREPAPTFNVIPLT